MYILYYNEFALKLVKLSDCKKSELSFHTFYKTDGASSFFRRLPGH
jgi:hypothetical protein